MEILSFVLGIASVMVLILVGAVIVGVVKMIDLKKEVINLSETIEDSSRYVDQEFTAVRREIEDTADDRTNELDDVYREIRELQSYVDSRVDKALLTK